MFAWLRVGRGPPAGTIIPLFAPPEGLSAAAVRYVERMRFDDRCFTAAIVDLAVGGHVQLSGTGKNTVITRRPGIKPIAPPENAAKSRLFGTEPSVALVQANYKPLYNAKRALMEGLKQSYDGKLFIDNYGWSGFGLVLVIALLLVTGALIAVTYDPDRAKALIFGTIMPLVPIIAGLSLIRKGRQAERLRTLQIVIGAILVVLFALAGHALISTVARGPIDYVPVLAAYILAPLALFGFHWLQAPTVTRAAASWIASRAFANISASPRRTGSTRLIRPTRPRNYSSDSCLTRSRSTSRLLGRRALLPYWRRRGPVRPSRPGTKAINAGTIRSLSATSWAARWRKPSRRPPARPARAEALTAAARPEAGVAAAVGRDGEGVDAIIRATK